jgi:general secretion pathway protein D
MKTIIPVLILAMAGLDLWAQTPPFMPHAAPNMRPLTNSPSGPPAFPRLPAPGGTPPAPGGTAPALPFANRPPNSPAPPAISPADAAPQKEIPGFDYDWSGVDVQQVLDVYADLVGRTLIRGQLPQASIVLKTESPLTKSEAIEALQAVLAINGISIVNIGDKFAKVLASTDAGGAGGAFNDIPANEMPDMGTYVTRIVQLNYVKPSAMVPVITPLAKLNSIIPLDDNGILVIRDYAENIKRMLEMIQKVDVTVPQEYISEVIPIKYALADDIASALNSVGGTGTATVSFGGSTAPSSVSGVGGGRMGGSTMPGSGATTGSSTSYNGLNSQSRPSTFGTQGTTTPNGTPTAGTSFQQRLQSIIQRAATTGGDNGPQPIQVFGQAKIIADERSNSLLIFATRQDMEQIKHVISQLDVLLSQVLLEAVIIDYDLGPNTFSFGASAAQNPQNYSPSVPAVGGGGINNGQSLLNLLSGFSPSNNVSGFASALPGGLSYFGNIGPNWNVALEAAASDSHATVIQRPRIQTSQAKPAQFFVGETVPYVTSTYNYGGAYGNQSSYSQLSVGVELDVTPFINPDGLVVMDIQQEIDDINGYTTISGVGNIPNTDKRTLSSEIAVRNGDTVMLGGFIKNQKSTSRSGVPFLQDIPLLGNLFSQRNDQKQREELIVMMRPTVLKTPEIAAENTVTEERRLPGVSAAEADESATELKIIDEERKKELSHPKSMSGGFYNNVTIPTNAVQDETASPSVQYTLPQVQAPQSDNTAGGFFSPVPPNGQVAQPAKPNNYTAPNP